MPSDQSDKSARTQAISVFVNVAKAFPSKLVWSFRNALQLQHVTPQVYQGVPKPVGEIVTSVYVEARNELLSSDVVALVLPSDSSGRVSDDWSLALIGRVRERGANVKVYLIPCDEPLIEWISWAEMDAQATSITSVASAEDVVAMLTRDIVQLIGGTTN